MKKLTKILDKVLEVILLSFATPATGPKSSSNMC